MELIIEIAGWVAAGMLLCAYALLSRGRLSGQGSSFQSLNVVGSLLVGVNSLAHEAWPSVSVNVVWLVIGVATLVAARRTPREHTAAADSAATGAIAPRDGTAPDSAVTPTTDRTCRTTDSGTDVGSFEGLADWRTVHHTLV